LLIAKADSAFIYSLKSGKAFILFFNIPLDVLMTVCCISGENLPDQTGVNEAINSCPSFLLLDSIKACNSEMYFVASEEKLLGAWAREIIEEKRKIITIKNVALKFMPGTNLSGN